MSRPFKNSTDCHIHFFPVRNLENRVFIKKGFSDFINHRYVCRYHGLDIHDPDFEENYLDYLNREIEQSGSVEKGVIFGLDGVYTGGKLDYQKTCFFVDNDYVYRAIRKRKHLIFGASINPQRGDALDALEKAVGQKAALIKFLPNSQGFAPDNPKFKKFYRSMAENKIPLLCHTGHEFALKSLDQSFGNPERFRFPLENGVTVIAAHGGSSGLVISEPFKKTILELAKKYPNFYLDSSALSIPSRIRIVPFLRKNPFLTDKLVFGTDFPLPVYLLPFLGTLGPGKILELGKIKNYFDRYMALMKSLGFFNN